MRRQRLDEHPADVWPDGHIQLRLGRHIWHDPRSLSYPAGVLPTSALRSVQWQRRIPVLDQNEGPAVPGGGIGACVGNAGTGWLGTDRLGPDGATVLLGLTAVAGGGLLDEAYAIDLYGECTRVDEFPGAYPPDDTGSSGLALAKVLKTRKLISGYQHAFSRQAIASGLQRGPVVIGVTWFTSMFTPNRDGGIPVDIRSSVAGGHELCMDGYDIVDGDGHDRFWVTNSWGPSWGLDGRGFFTGHDLDTLMSHVWEGDAVIPTLAAGPQPVPVPLPVSRVAGPADDAMMRAMSKALEDLARAGGAWMSSFTPPLKP